MIHDVVLGLKVGRAAATNPPRAVLDALESVEINQDDGDRGPGQGAELVFRADDAAAGDVELLRSTALELGNRIVVTATVGTQTHVVFDGLVTHHRLSAAGGETAGSLAVTARDIGVLLDLEERSRPLPPLGVSGVVQYIVQPYASWGVQARVRSPNPDWLRSSDPEYRPFQHGTDLSYLKSLAATCGWLFTLRPGESAGQVEAVFGAPDGGGQPQPPLVVSGVGSTVDDLTFTQDALVPEQLRYVDVDARGAPGQERTTPATAPKDPFSAHSTRAIGGPFPRTRRLDVPRHERTRLEATAAGRVVAGDRRAVVARGTLDVMRYGQVLRPCTTVTVAGAGSSYNGQYAVSAVKHLLTRGSYTQEFTLVRGGTGGMS